MEKLFKSPRQVFHLFQYLVPAPPRNLQCVNCSKIFPAHLVLSFKLEMGTCSF